MLVRIYTLSAKVIIIQTKSDLCELHEVKVLRNIDPVATEEETVTVKQHRVAEEKDKIEEQIPVIGTGKSVTDLST